MTMKALTVAFMTIALPLSAHAQTVPITAKFDVTSKPVKIRYAMPAECDINIANAAAAFNRAGANFQLTSAGSVYDNQWVDDNNTDPAYINVLPATLSNYTDATTLMQTNLYYSWFDGFAWESYYEITDANVYVNANYIYYVNTEPNAREKDLWCNTSTSGIGSRSDFETNMLHEFGHAAGLQHRTDGGTGPCVMTRYYSPGGKIRRSFCTDEINALRGAYGTR